MTEMAICKDCGDIEEFEPDEFGLNFYQAIGTCPVCQKLTYFSNGEYTKITVNFKIDKEKNRGVKIVGYKCPGCRGVFGERLALLDHFDIEKICAAEGQVLLQGSLQISLDDLKRIYDGQPYRERWRASNELPN